MAAEKQNVTLYEGDSAVFRVSVLDESGSPLNLSGYTAEWILTDVPGNPALVTKTIGGGIAVDSVSGGVLSVTLGAGDTGYEGRFWHQLVLTSSDNASTTVTTGTVTIKPRTA